MLRCSILLSCAILAACIPIPSRRITGPSGTAKSEDISFISEGSTTRADVLQKLAWMDSGIDESRLFWGRWSSSKVVWVGGAPQLGAGAIRPWSTRNLMIEFDDNGVVARSRLIEEGNLTSELLSWWKRGGRKPLERSLISAMNVAYVENTQVVEATLRVRGGVLELREAPQSNRSVRFTLSEILRFGSLTTEGEAHNQLTQRIYFREGLDTPQDIIVRVAPRHFYTLLKYAASSDASIPDPTMAAPVQLAPANGAVLNAFPRTTTVTWNPTPRAIAYIVQWEYRTGSTWSGEQRDFPDYESMVSRPSFTFNFVGAQEGRWRVWPVNIEGLRGTPSEWRTFRYTQ
jgi:hypothetical protein